MTITTPSTSAPARRTSAAGDVGQATRHHLGMLDRRALASSLSTGWIARRGALAGLAVLLVAVVAAAVGLPWWAVVAVAVVLAGAVAAWIANLRRRDPLSAVLGLLGVGDGTEIDPSPVGAARPADARRDARLLNMVENLSFVAGATLPDVFVIESPAANALVAQGTERAVLAATAGLVEQLDLMELEGVVAILLARLRHGDAVLAATALAFAAPARRSELLGSERVIGFDLEGARLTRYPPALARAFERLAATPTDVDAPIELDDFWLVPPSRQGRHESPAVRAAVMHEL